MPPKILYLLGTGATHAEKHIECKIRGTGFTPSGDLIEGLTSKQVSRRVIKKLLEDNSEMLKRYGITSDIYHSAYGEIDVDIELFISLLKKINTEQSEADVRILRKCYRNDICKNLKIGGHTITPRLLSSLIEFHNSSECDEELLGFLTLNYDSILESALTQKHQKFDYGIEGITTDTSINYPFEQGNPFLLKMHGSFDWFLDSDDTNKIIVKANGNAEAMQWLPPQLHKDYEKYPFKTIHERAQNLLERCDILRIIGCSLHFNDISLISLLFRTQTLKRPNTFNIEFIGSEKRLRDIITNRLGGLLSFEESFYNSDDWGKLGKNSSYNPFLDWLYYKINKTSISDISNTRYLKDISSWVEL